MKIAYVALGGNIGNVKVTLERACQELKAIPQITSFKISKFYQTTPVGKIDQPNFVNAVCSFETCLEAKELLEHLVQIEKKFDKVWIEKNGPRTIDLDILFFGNDIIDLPYLQIPHPRWKERLFVIKPLSDLTHTIGGENILELIATFKNQHREDVQEL